MKDNTGVLICEVSRKAEVRCLRSSQGWSLGREAIKVSKGRRVEEGGWDARVWVNRCSSSFLAHRSGPVLVRPSLPVPQLELPPSCQVEFFRGRTLGAPECPCASVPLDHQSWSSQPSPCSLPRDCFPPAQT